MENIGKEQPELEDEDPVMTCDNCGSDDLRETSEDMESSDEAVYLWTCRDCGNIMD